MEKSDYPVYEATKQCAKCKGQCCMYMPGHYSPSDFPDLSYDALKTEIEKGGIAIDWWEATPNQYYLRARQIGENVVHGSWGGICVNLTPRGCRLSWEERPLGCRSVKPRKNKRGDCVGSYTKEICKNDWQQHSVVLNKLVEFFNNGVSSDPLLTAMEGLKKWLWLNGLRG